MHQLDGQWRLPRKSCSAVQFSAVILIASQKRNLKFEESTILSKQVIVDNDMMMRVV